MQRRAATNCSLTTATTGPPKRISETQLVAPTAAFTPMLLMRDVAGSDDPKRGPRGTDEANLSWRVTRKIFASHRREKFRGDPEFFGGSYETFREEHFNFFHWFPFHSRRVPNRILICCETDRRLERREESGAAHEGLDCFRSVSRLLF